MVLLEFSMTPCIFQPIVDGVSGWTWTRFQRDRGRHFKLIVDAVSVWSWTIF